MGSTQREQGWREAEAGAEARGPLRWSPGLRGHEATSPGRRLLQDRASTAGAPGHQASGRDPEVKQRPEVPLPSSPRPPPSGPGGRAQPARVPFPWLGTHPGSLRGLLCGWSQGIGARGPANEQGEDSRVDPAARGSQGPSRRPSRLTQIAEAPGEEPLAAPGSRLLPPALLSPRLRACCSHPQAGSEAAAPLHPVRLLAHHCHRWLPSPPFSLS